MSTNNYSVEIFPQALKDLDGIYAYYFEESKEIDVAKKVVAKIKKALYGLDFMPHSHPSAREPRLAKKGIRKLIFEDYIIPFLINENNKVVSIVRVFHGKMNYQKYL